MILSTGDPVLVVAGELKGQSGVVDGVEGDVVKLKITKNNKSVVVCTVFFHFSSAVVRNVQLCWVAFPPSVDVLEVLCVALTV